MTDLLVAIRKYRGLAIGIARSWRRRLPPNVLLEDLEQAALIGLFEWKSSHPEESTPGWIGGLRMRIHGSIKDELRHEDWLPRRRREAQRSGDGPVRIVGYDDVDKDWEAHWAGASESAEDLAIRNQEVAEALRAPMNPTDAQVVRLAYFRGLMFKDVARRLECSEPRVSQRHDRALEVMRAQLTGEVRRPARAQRERREEQHEEEARDDFEFPASGIYPKGGGAVTSTLPEEGIDLLAELARYQQWMIEQALIRTGGDQEQTAKLLRLERTTLAKMLQRPSEAPHADGRIATLRALGYSAKRVAGKLGLNYWAVEREYSRLAAAESVAPRQQEVGS